MDSHFRFSFFGGCPCVAGLKALGRVSKNPACHVADEGTTDFIPLNWKVGVGHAGGRKKDDIAGVEVDDESSFVQDELPALGSVMVAEDVHPGDTECEVLLVAVVVTDGARAEVDRAGGEGGIAFWRAQSLPSFLLRRVFRIERLGANDALMDIAAMGVEGRKPRSKTA